MRCVILDDYQQVALGYADWSRLAGVETMTVDRHLADEDTLVAALIDAEIVVVMRERTPLTARLLSRLPRLRLVVTSGMRNASLDLAACAERGVTVCGTASSSTPPGRRWAWSASARSAPGSPRRGTPSSWRCSPGARTGPTTGPRPPGAAGRQAGALRRERRGVGAPGAGRDDPRHRRRARRETGDGVPRRHPRWPGWSTTWRRSRRSMPDGFAAVLGVFDEEPLPARQSAAPRPADPRDAAPRRRHGEHLPPLLRGGRGGRRAWLAGSPLRVL